MKSTYPTTQIWAVEALSDSIGRHPVYAAFSGEYELQVKFDDKKLDRFYNLHHYELCEPADADISLIGGGERVSMKHKPSTLVVNLYGAPGSGKSTGSAYIFSRLKLAGWDAEFVSEFAKDKVWEKNDAVFDNPSYLYGKQSFRLSRVAGNVDVIVTDSPLLIPAYYNRTDTAEELTALAKKELSHYYCYNVFVNRVKKYNPNGRFQTESESNEVANELRAFLTTHGVNDLVDINGDPKGYDEVIEEIVNNRLIPYVNR